MAHGKETPRQKMIGMMYLVLTALLALNVSAEILNAFTMIDRSIRTTTDNFQSKNEKVYTEFEIAMAENESKVKPWKDKADEVKLKAQALYALIQDLKVKLVTTADGPEGSPEDINKKDDNNVGGQIMILEGNGVKVKDAINEFREHLISLYPDTVSEETTDALKRTLSTDEVLNTEGELMPWENANFEHLPLAGVIALMSKMQSDVRNAEAQILTYLLGQIDAGSFKFNKLEAIVNAPTGYVLQGQPYKAEIFIAASDTTKDPVVILSGGTQLAVFQGKATYTGETGSVGIKTVSGEIQVESPSTGEILHYPFETTYQVGAPAVAVSPTKMNVFYIGVDNPVDITASGVDAADLMVSISSGSIVKQSSGSYIVTVKSGTTTTISVSAKVGDATKSLGSKEFRIKVVPDPVAKIGGSKGGNMSQATLLAQSFVKAEMENFDFDLVCTVTSFKVSATVGGFLEEVETTGATISAAQKALIAKLKTGGKVYFEEIKATSAGTSRDLGTVAFKLN